MVPGSVNGLERHRTQAPWFSGSLPGMWEKLISRGVGGASSRSVGGAPSLGVGVAPMGGCGWGFLQEFGLVLGIKGVGEALQDQ